MIYFRLNYTDRDSDEGTDHILLIPQPGTEIETASQSSVPCSQPIRPLSILAANLISCGTADMPVVLDWRCARCNCRPNTQPVVYGELQFCFSCCLRCPNCYLMVPLGSTHSYQSTYLCTICNLSVNDPNGPGMVVVSEYDEERDFPKNNLLACQYAHRIGLGMGYLVDIATAAAKTGKKRTLGMKKAHPPIGTKKPFITPRHRE